ncbi:hypothetical protein EBU71_23370, partial [bacterium]|nr:hypothetical protein [Candidatus Elulimicrobium humile]
MSPYHWSNWLYTGLGIWVGTYLQPAMDTLGRLHQTFQQQNCVNTVLPEMIEPYIPRQVINTLEMMKFIGQQLWIQVEQKLCQTCVKSPEGIYHIHCVIEQKRY